MRHGKAGSQGERWFLLYDYLTKNTGKGKVATRQQIYDHLKNYGIKISANTLYADLAVLGGEVFGLSIQYDQKRNGYWVENPPFEQHELRLMIDCIQSSKFITEKTANKISRKIKKLASVESRNTLERPAMVSNRVRSMNESVIEEADIIHEAIATDKKISFFYFHRIPNRSNPRRYDKKGFSTVVSPYAMVWDNGNYYLYGYEASSQKFKTYRVDRMNQINLEAIGREGAKEYNKKDVIARQTTVFDMYHGNDCLVELRCHNKIADSVLDKFGSNTALMVIDDEHFTAHVRVELSPPFYAWVATFGDQIKIVSPNEAVEGIKGFVQTAADMYRENEER